MTVPKAPPDSVPKAPSPILKAVKLDALTVADDPEFLDRIEGQPNVPEPVRKELKELY